jgi:hypothetical protein
LYKLIYKGAPADNETGQWIESNTLPSQKCVKRLSGSKQNRTAVTGMSNGQQTIIPKPNMPANHHHKSVYNGSVDQKQNHTAVTGVSNGQQTNKPKPNMSANHDQNMLRWVMELSKYTSPHLKSSSGT